MSMADRDGKIWMDGKLIDWRDANDPRADPHAALRHGRLRRRARLQDARRAPRSSACRNTPSACSTRPRSSRWRFRSTCKRSWPRNAKCVRENKLESCYLRPIVWFGSEKMGVSAKGNTIHVAIAAWPWGAYLGEDGLAKGIRVKTSSFTRHHVNVSMVRAKACGYYINSILANQEALTDGYDEALLLDPTAMCRKARAKTSSS